MEIKLGQFTLDAVGNLSLFLAGSTEPYIVFPVDKTAPIWSCFEGLEIQLLESIKTQLKLK